ATGLAASSSGCAALFASASPDPPFEAAATSAAAAAAAALTTNTVLLSAAGSSGLATDFLVGAGPGAFAWGNFLAAASLPDFRPPLFLASLDGCPSRRFACCFLLKQS